MTIEPATSRPSDDRSAERWYLRIDDQRYGPVGRAELEQFLRPPRLCNVLEVKCGDDGEWCYINRSETIDKVLVRFGVEPDPVAEPIPQQATRASRGPRFLAGPRDFLEGLAAWLVYHWVGVAAVIAIVAINGTVLLALRDPNGREREILGRYEALWKSAREFTADTSSEDWRKFTEPALAELEPIVKELEKSASVHHPSRQNLLYAGRDHLRKILQAERPPAVPVPQTNAPIPQARGPNPQAARMIPQTAGMNPQVALFERRMQTARAQFSAAPGGPTQPLVKGTR